MLFNTEELIERTTGKNRSFLRRAAKAQKDKYGNVDVFEAKAKNENDIEISFGENWIRFRFNGDEVRDMTGTGQGHRYQDALKRIAEELHEQLKLEREIAEYYNGDPYDYDRIADILIGENGLSDNVVDAILDDLRKDEEEYM